MLLLITERKNLPHSTVFFFIIIVIIIFLILWIIYRTMGTKTPMYTHTCSAAVSQDGKILGAAITVQSVPAETHNHGQIKNTRPDWSAILVRFLDLTKNQTSQSCERWRRVGGKQKTFKPDRGRRGVKEEEIANKDTVKVKLKSKVSGGV